jgi:hypothetical protein
LQLSELCLRLQGQLWQLRWQCLQLSEHLQPHSQQKKPQKVLWQSWQQL